MTSTIIVADGKSTPVNHTLIPVRTLGLSQKWRENVTGVSPAAQTTLTMKVDGPNQKTGLNKVTMTMDIPVLEPVVGTEGTGVAVPKVAFSDRVIVSFILPDRGTQAQRNDLLVMLKNLCSDAQVRSAIVDLLPTY